MEDWRVGRRPDPDRRQGRPRLLAGHVRLAVIGNVSDDQYLNIWHARTGRRIAVRRDLQLHVGPVLRFDKEGALPYYWHSQRYTFPHVPLTSGDLKTFVESWTGMTLDGSDVQILKKLDWLKRVESMQELPFKG